MLNERPEPVYEVKTASRCVERQLDKLDDEIYPKVAEAIKSLANNPRPFGVKKRVGRVHRIRVGPYRIIYRVGPYRIIYSIYDREKVVVIDKVDRRKERTYK
jgi:mRNA interferase RelE/StbE